MHEALSNIIWETLFGENFEDVPNPNLPENEPYIKATKQQRVDALKRFVEGDGRVLFDQWQMEVRRGLFELMTQKTDCNCELAQNLRTIREKINLIASASMVLAENRE